MAKLGLKIAFKGWLSKAPQGPSMNPSYSNSNSNWRDQEDQSGLKAKDVAHLLWTYADDRASWVTLTGERLTLIRRSIQLSYASPWLLFASLQRTLSISSVSDPGYHPLDDSDLGH